MIKKIYEDVTRIFSSVISTNSNYYVKTTVFDSQNAYDFIFPILAQIKFSSSENSWSLDMSSIRCKLADPEVCFLSAPSPKFWVREKLAHGMLIHYIQISFLFTIAEILLSRKMGCGWTRVNLSSYSCCRISYWIICYDNDCVVTFSTLDRVQWTTAKKKQLPETKCLFTFIVSLEVRGPDYKTLAVKTKAQNNPADSVSGFIF